MITPDTVIEPIKIALERLQEERDRAAAAILKLEAFLVDVDSLGPSADPADIELLALGRRVRTKRSTTGWTPSKRVAAGHRMRKYWAEKHLKKEKASSAGDPNSSLSEQEQKGV